MNFSEKNQPLLAQTSQGKIEYVIREGKKNKSPETVLCLHGAMGGYEQSDILGRSVGPEGYKYISVSRPGYLHTPLHGHEEPEAQADLFAALLDELELNKIIVLAISGGGYSAIHFALRHPERCSALILCSTIGGKNDVPIPFTFNVMKFIARFQLLVNLMRTRFEKNIEKSLKRSVSYQDLFDKMMGDPEMLAYYKQITLSTMDRMAERIPGTINDIRITQKTEYPLEDITVPTLVIHGTDDPVVPYNNHGKKLVKRIPDAQSYIAERGEHMTIFTHNGHIRKTVKSFLENIHGEIIQV